MNRGIWSGSISFGLIQIDVSLQTARESKGLHFKLLDKKDLSQVGHQYYNKKSGSVLKWANITKGYEVSKNRFVIVNEADFKRANPKATKTIDLQSFVEFKEIDPMLFDNAYYLVPTKKSTKAYALLRETLEKTGRAGIGSLVMRAKQHVCAIVPRGDYLVCQMMHYAEEVLQANEAHYLSARELNPKVNPKELKMAETLVESMSDKWRPDEFKDEYTKDLLKLIHDKAKGRLKVVSTDEPDTESTSNVIKLMPLLERSLKNAVKKGRGSHSKASARHSART